jgi:hypothetical protein
MEAAARGGNSTKRNNPEDVLSDVCRVVFFYDSIVRVQMWIMGVAPIR